jgi:hypothetical protein
MGAPIRNITIVGGGTAGWLTAAFLNHRLQWGAAHPEGFTITLIEAPGIPTVGVGEATIPGLRQTLAMLEIDENEFVARTDATFKLGVRFDGWSDPAGPKPASYFHPFSGGVQIAGRNPAASLLAYGVPPELGLDPQLGNLLGDAVAAAEAGKSPRSPDDRPYNGALSYAYHLDAGKFAEFLREVATARGVKHVRDRVAGVERTEKGLIGALTLEEGGRFPVELVVDCSGFRGLLINGAMEEPFESYSDYLPNDRAVAIQIAHDRSIKRPTATVSTALAHGWRWEIGLQSRVGTGYVYSGAFLEPEAAVTELLASMPGAEPITNPNFVAMRIGRCRRSWVGNCVAIGLASGFVEPLESTAIQFVDYACRRLLQCLPSLDFEPAPIAKFNTQIADLYEDIRDFLGLHFVLSDRDDNDYWRMCRHDLKRSDRLTECLDFWRHGLPDPFDPRSTEVFTSWSVNCLLLGKGFYGDTLSAGTDLLPREYWDRYLHHLSNFRPARLARLHDQAAVLDSMNAAARHGASANSAARPQPAPMMGYALGPNLPVMTADPSMAALA